jgi:hypothetical protein
VAVVAASLWAENLVLRGSVVLPTWLGEAAREPDDLDFVVTPRTLPPEAPHAHAMMEGLVAAVAADPGPGLRADQVVSERILTYERVPGRRLMFPFDVEGLPQGVVPVDLVFNEPLPEEPVITEVPPAGTPSSPASSRGTSRMATCRKCTCTASTRPWKTKRNRGCAGSPPPWGRHDTADTRRRGARSG